MQAQNTLSLFAACIFLPLAAAVGPSGPTQPGAPADCVLWYSAKEGDTASEIATSYNIRLETFLGANPQLSSDPELSLWEGYDYCVPQGSKTLPTQDSNKDSTGIETGSSAEDTSNAHSTAEETSITESTAEETSDGDSTAEGSGSSEEIGSIAETPSTIEKTGSPFKNSSATSKESATSSQSSESSESPTGAQSIAETQSSKSSQSTSQTTKSSQSAAPPESTSDSESNMSSQSGIGFQSTTPSQGSGSSGQGSTLTTSIVAPTKGESGTQSDTPSEGDEDDDDLAETFGAARRDLERSETTRRRELDSEIFEPSTTVTRTMSTKVIAEIYGTTVSSFTSTLPTPIVKTYTFGKHTKPHQ